MSVGVAELAVQLQRKRSENLRRTSQVPIVVGKDILELLSTAMYVDPRTIFREYVQNSADAIDEAFASGLLSSVQEGRIDISLNPTTREIRIRDNGVGIPQAEVERVMTSFGASKKRGKAVRGFRGVGRLAALGYAQYLTFRTKAAKESSVTELRWDCRKLKTILLDHSYDGQLSQVITEVLSVAVEPAERPSDHFFEVHLEKVVRIKNDILLNEAEVSRYLGQVAPVPQDPQFPFAQVIADHISAHLPASTLNIVINGAEKPITRPFKKEILVTSKKADVVTGVRCFELKGDQGETSAVGWLLDHGHLGAIQGSSEMRGLRARVGDIQIGGDDIFAAVFPEARFNAWTIGEIHILDRAITPNGRRDDFEQNPAYFRLIGQLTPIAREIGRRCRTSSAQRNRIKACDRLVTTAEARVKTLERMPLSKRAASKLRRELESTISVLDRMVGGELVAEPSTRRVRRRIARLRSRMDKARMAPVAVDLLSGLPSRKRVLYNELFGLIYECASSKDAAKTLIARIAARLTK